MTRMGRLCSPTSFPTPQHPYTPMIPTATNPDPQTTNPKSQIFNPQKGVAIHPEAMDHCTALVPLARKWSATLPRQSPPAAFGQAIRSESIVSKTASHSSGGTTSAGDTISAGQGDSRHTSWVKTSSQTRAQSEGWNPVQIQNPKLRHL